MIRYFFAFVILLHGLVHIIGYSKAFGYGNIQQFSRDISKPIGSLWLLAAILFVVTVVLFLWKQANWWMFAIPAVLLSQVLIVMYWKDAKFGTIANLLLLAVVIIAYAHWNFNAMLKKEVSAMLSEQEPSSKIVDNEMISSLPPVVQKWLKRSGAVGKPISYTLRLKQQGMMRTKVDGKWMDFTSKQYFTTGRPAFNWQVEVNMMPLVYLEGRDKYEHGRGEMLINILSLKNIVDSKGTTAIDQGTLLRYLSEMCWFPSAALSDYIKWEVLDNNSARATMHYNNVTASGIFFFNNEGDASGFEAMRYGEFDGKTSLEKWCIESKAYRVFEGIRIPGSCEVTWKLAKGDFTWLKLELLAVEYNRPGMF